MGDLDLATDLARLAAAPTVSLDEAQGAMLRYALQKMAEGDATVRELADLMGSLAKLKEASREGTGGGGADLEEVKQQVRSFLQYGASE